MVIYPDENDLRWLTLPGKGLEVALLAHADPGRSHGECIGLSKAFDLASRFGAIPIGHLTAYELMVDFPRQFSELMRVAGSNHLWLSSTLCVYTAPGVKNIRPKRIRRDRLLDFGYIEERSGTMDEIVYPEREGLFRVYNTVLGGPSQVYSPEELSPTIFISVPEEMEGELIFIQYPDYSLRREGNLTRIDVDWERAIRIGPDAIDLSYNLRRFRNSALLPGFLSDGFKETWTYFNNPTLGFFAPAESYGPMGRDGRNPDEYNHWAVSTRGEAVIIQRPSRLTPR